MLEMLSQRLPITYIDWRIGQASKSRDKKWAKILCYVDARAVMDRLDGVVGQENWQDMYAPSPGGGNLCSLGLRVSGEWVWKQDVGENTDIEGPKGGISDAFKRAAVKWGIGRYLYGIGETWAEVSDKETASCPHRHASGGETMFYWGPPKKAYRALGYTDDEINSLPYYGGSKSAGATSPAQASPPAPADNAETAPAHEMARKILSETAGFDLLKWQTDKEVAGDHAASAALEAMLSLFGCDTASSLADWGRGEGKAHAVALEKLGLKSAWVAAYRAHRDALSRKEVS